MHGNQSDSQVAILQTQHAPAVHLSRLTEVHERLADALVADAGSGQIGEPRILSLCSRKRGKERRTEVARASQKKWGEFVAVRARCLLAERHLALLTCVAR